MAYVLVGIYVLLISPMQVGLRIRWKAGFFEITVGIMAWGIKKAFPFLLQKEKGHWQLHAPFSLKPRRKHTRKDLLSLPARLLYVRKKIHSGIRLKTLQAQAGISLPSAAATAQACGLLSALFALLLPEASVCLKPACHQGNTGSIVCIVDFRLGTLCLAGLLWKTHRPANNRQEEKIWSIPSEN